MIRMKGQEFVDEIQARFPHLLEQLLSTSDPLEKKMLIHQLFILDLEKVLQKMQS